MKATKTKKLSTHRSISPLNEKNRLITSNLSYLDKSQFPLNLSPTNYPFIIFNNHPSNTNSHKAKVVTAHH
jgi:hypothetical protein